MKALDKVKGFINETRHETKKVVWPSRKYVAAATGIILVMVFLVAVYVMVVDYAFTVIFGTLLK